MFGVLEIRAVMRGSGIVMFTLSRRLLKGLACLCKEHASSTQVAEEKCLNPKDPMHPFAYYIPILNPLYVAYHDEEWGVPLHDDNLACKAIVDYTTLN
ncbi:hypothetical protein IFM89_012568 [Coptis chinensis]|uniref:Uncharacterized protein n=1 Tax=Coptis chinensis TaxID=261450 RepID=A0A835H375_9MAGN|nr:hypothetical protein IFM89_012568 [Coptis chinensis]